MPDGLREIDDRVAEAVGQNAMLLAVGHEHARRLIEQPALEARAHRES